MGLNQLTFSLVPHGRDTETQLSVNLADKTARYRETQPNVADRGGEDPIFVIF
jgi:hypothetical protein